MGGTSFDVSLIETAARVRDSQVEIDVGCRRACLGGHAARSAPAAAASPPSTRAAAAGRPAQRGRLAGPGRYGRGGTEPTVTDANLVLGRLDPARVCSAGGSRSTQAAAETALATLAETFGVEVDELARGVHGTVSANMAQAVRQITVRKGIDPRECALIAFGGAGGAARRRGRRARHRDVVIPAHGSVLSAVGLLTAAAASSRRARCCSRGAVGAGCRRCVRRTRRRRARAARRDRHHGAADRRASGFATSASGTS